MADEEKEEKTSKKKGGSVVLIIVVFLFVVLLAVVGLIGFFMFQGPDEAPPATSAAAGAEPGAGGPAGVRPDVRAGESGNRRVHPQEPRGNEAGSGNGVRAFSPAQGAREAAGGHAVRRRAADAGHGPGADESPRVADAG